MEINIGNLDQIRPAAHEFIEKVLPGHNVVAFYGKMGAGKTTFIKALCEEMGVEDTVTSPTFALVNEYSIPHLSEGVGGRLFHFDFYRIKRLEEAVDMGFDDYLYSGRPCFIEWPELVEPLLPNDTVRVILSENPDGSRSLTME